ncbi:class I SAM-dependent methyltransferase [Paenibacillus donghaensis]|uniref:class I SAM-dependent methyltransferase n=1 Tax=Paenibacillus donghaensis TaxID=414771 RepID=UPI001471BAF9|nr:class I SAM-dependent methyltransferase [Paenibacillus donghaensis]
MNQIPFDQFQRYNNVKKIIDGLRNGNERYRILEVGANEHQNLERFLPIDKITYLDIQLPKELETNPKYILGDATQMTFEDNAYDIVVALDVYEHIPPEKRNKFIDELSRVSAHFFVITAPFYSEEVKESENRLNTLYASMFKENFIWLEEHAENGLPILSELVQYLEHSDNNFNIISHGNVDIWEKIMSMHFFAAQNPELIMYREKVDQFYNEHIFNCDYSDQSYRKIVIGSKSMTVNKISIGENKQVPLKELAKLQELENSFFELRAFFIKESTEKKLSEFKNDLQQFKIDIAKEKEKEKDKLQLYVNTGIGFSEEQSLAYHLENRNEGSFYFNLSEFNEVKSLRIDPSMFSGIFEIKKVKINNEFCDIKMKGNYVLDLRNETFVFENDDPFIEFSLDKSRKIEYLEFQCMPVKTSTLVSELKTLQNVADEYLTDLKLKNVINNSLEEQVSDSLLKNKSLTGQINNKENEITEKERFIKILEDTNKDLKTEIAKKEEEQRLLALKQTELTAELSGIYSSRSWKLVKRLKSLINK